MEFSDTYQYQWVSVSMMLYDVQVRIETVDLFPRLHESKLMQLVGIVTNSSDQSSIDICEQLISSHSKQKGDRQGSIVSSYQSLQVFSCCCLESSAGLATHLTRTADSGQRHSRHPSSHRNTLWHKNCEEAACSLQKAR